jgi:two-component system, chemotaxis family, chemotaxis protein CheY
MPVDPRLRILIVDDQDTVLEILRSMLRKLGFRNVDTAKDGNEAFDKLRAAIFPYGLVISDWNMQPISGLELLEAVRADEKLARTPFIMITAENTPERVIAARDAGVTHYLTKPFSLDAVKRRLVAAFGEF